MKIPDATRRKISLALRGKPKSEKHKINLSLAKLGKKGKPHTEKTKEKMRLASIGKPKSKVHRENISLGLRGRPKPPRSKEYRENISLAHIGKQRSEKTKEKIRQSLKGLWENKEFRENHLNKMLKGLFKRPTSLEKRFNDEFIISFDLPFSYCGNGTLIIGGRCPDFYENNGKKICIDVANKNQKIYCCGWKSQKEYANFRINHFTKYGWKCLVFWEDELINKEKILKKIKEVLI